MHSPSQVNVGSRKATGALETSPETLACGDSETGPSSGSEALVNFPSVETRYGQMFYFADDDPVGKSLKAYGEWAEHEIELLCSFIGLGSTVIDVGANIGTHTLAFSRHVGPRGSVRAFEPQASVFEILQRNLAANGCANTEPIRAGVGRAAGEMFVPELDYCRHVNIGALALTNDRTRERTPIVALDDLDLPPCDLIKIDAEGMEEDVLAGMASSISRMRPVIYLECNTVDTGAAILHAVEWTEYQFFLVRTAAYNDLNYMGNSSNFFGVAHECGILCVPEAIRDLVPESKPGIEFLPVLSLHTLADGLLKAPQYGDSTIYDRDPVRMRRALTESFESQIRELTARSDAAEARRCAAEDRASAHKTNFANLQMQLQEITTRLKEAEARARTAEHEVSLHDTSCKSLDAQVRDLTARLGMFEAKAREAEDIISASRADCARLEFRAASLTRQLELTEEQLARLESKAAGFVGAQNTISALTQNINAMRGSISWRITAPLRRIMRVRTT
jgi:FkbM family methyltransferase